MVNSHNKWTTHYLLWHCWLCSAWVGLSRALRRQNWPLGSWNFDFWVAYRLGPFHRKEWERNLFEHH
jgi:hypothetical protein